MSIWWKSAKKFHPLYNEKVCVKADISNDFTYNYVAVSIKLYLFSNITPKSE